MKKSTAILWIAVAGIIAVVFCVLFISGSIRNEVVSVCETGFDRVSPRRDSIERAICFENAFRFFDRSFSDLIAQRDVYHVSDNIVVNARKDDRDRSVPFVIDARRQRENTVLRRDGERSLAICAFVPIGFGDAGRQDVGAHIFGGAAQRLVTLGTIRKRHFAIAHAPHDGIDRLRVVCLGRIVDCEVRPLLLVGVLGNREGRRV